MGFTTPNKLNERVRSAEGGGRNTLPSPLSPLPRPPTPDPRTPTPDPRTPPPASRPAFTLIELLIVISIMMILVALTATMMRPDVEGRRVREATRSINVYLASARNRATETGRPCGVIFRNFGAPGFAMNADQCEVPPSYCGETYDASVIAQDWTKRPSEPDESVLPYWGDGSVIVKVRLLSPLAMSPGLVRRGDLMQINLQGPVFTIIADDPALRNTAGISFFPPGMIPQDYPVDTNGFIDFSSGTPASVLTLRLEPAAGAITPWPEARVPSDGWSHSLQFSIFRAPIKGFAQPLQLPAATVVDLTASGVGTGVGAADFTVLFSPNGAVECVYIGAVRHSVVDPIYLLVGKRERVDNGYTADNTNEDTLTNYQDLGNRWVTINPQTGAVQTEPVASCAGVADKDAAIIVSRSEAIKALGMGGK